MNAEITQRGRLHTIAFLPQEDFIEVGLQDLILFIALFHLQGAVDLRHLTQNRILIVLGDILYCLLCDGRTALNGFARQRVDDGADGGLKVHAGMALEALVLNGDGGVFQMVGNLVKTHPNAILAVHEEGLIHDPLLRLGILIVQLRGHRRFKLVDVDLGAALQRGVDPRHEDDGKDQRRAHRRQHQCADGELPWGFSLLPLHREASLLSGSRFALGSGRIGFCIFGALLAAGRRVLASLTSAISTVVFTHRHKAPPFLI